MGAHLKRYHLQVSFLIFLPILYFRLKLFLKFLNLTVMEPKISVAEPKIQISVPALAPAPAPAPAPVPDSFLRYLENYLFLPWVSNKIKIVTIYKNLSVY
jgi:hypothetical protein